MQFVENKTEDISMNLDRIELSKGPGSTEKNDRLVYEYLYKHAKLTSCGTPVLENPSKYLRPNWRSRFLNKYACEKNGWITITEDVGGRGPPPIGKITFHKTPDEAFGSCSIDKISERKSTNTDSSRKMSGDTGEKHSIKKIKDFKDLPDLISASSRAPQIRKISGGLKQAEESWKKISGTRVEKEDTKPKVKAQAVVAESEKRVTPPIEEVPQVSSKTTVAPQNEHRRVEEDNRRQIVAEKENPALVRKLKIGDEITASFVTGERDNYVSDGVCESQIHSFQTKIKLLAEETVIIAIKGKRNKINVVSFEVDCVPKGLLMFRNSIFCDSGSRDGSFFWLKREMRDLPIKKLLEVKKIA